MQGVVHSTPRRRWLLAVAAFLEVSCAGTPSGEPMSHPSTFVARLPQDAVLIEHVVRQHNDLLVISGHQLIPGSARDLAFVLIGDSVEAVSLPDSRHVSFPLVFPDESGRLHLVWGEPPPSSLDDPLPTRVEHIRHRVFEDDGWGTTRDLLIGDSFSWGFFAGSFYSNGSWGIAVRTRSPGELYHAATIVRHGSDFQVNSLRIPQWSVDATKIASRDGVALVAVLAAQSFENVRSADGAGLFIARSSDAGASWSEPVPIPDVLLNGIGNLLVEIGPDEIVHLVWTEFPGTATNQIERADVLPDGQTVRFAAVKQQEPIRHVRVAAGSDGQLYLAFLAGSLDRPRLVAGKWGAPLQTLEAANGAGVAMGAAFHHTLDRVALYWLWASEDALQENQRFTTTLWKTTLWNQ